MPSSNHNTLDETGSGIHRSSYDQEENDLSCFEASSSRSPLLLKRERDQNHSDDQLYLCSMSSTPLGQESTKERLSFLTMLRLCAMHLSHATCWFYLLIVLVPSRIHTMKGVVRQGHGMFDVFFTSGILAFMTNPLIGIWSDRMQSVYGRRRPLMTTGVLLLLLTLPGLYAYNNFGLFIVMFNLITLFGAMESVPFQGLIADHVPVEQRGTVSGILGFYFTLGNIVGAGIGYLYADVGPLMSYLLLCCLFIICTLITNTSVNDKISSISTSEFTWYALPGMILAPFRQSTDFCWVVLSRFIAQFGLSTIEGYLQYWLSSCINLPKDMNAEKAVSISFLPSMIASSFMAMCIGYITDRMTSCRKQILYISGLTIAILCICLIWIHSLSQVLILSAAYGLCYGTYYVLSMAMLLDILPNKEHTGRDMSLWHIALNIPQIFAAPLAGLLLDILQSLGSHYGNNCLGYHIIFGMTATYFVMATWVISWVKDVR